MGGLSLIWSGTSEISFVYVFILHVLAVRAPPVCCTSGRMSNMMSPILTGGYPREWRLVWEFHHVLLYLKARSKKCAYYLRGRMRRLLMQLNASRSLFHSFEQIPETCYCVGNGTFLWMGRAVNVLVNKKDEKAVVGKWKESCSEVLKLGQLGF